MNPWSRLVRVLRSLAGHGPIDRDLDQEMAAYLELLTEEKMASGSAPEVARLQARLELGGLEQVKEEVRAGRPAAWLDAVARDVRHGLRVLAKTPAFSVAAIAILALGIGANAAVFGLVNVLLLQPPPGSDQPGRPVGIYTHDPKTPDSYRGFSYAEYEAIRDQAHVFEQVMAHRPLRVVFTDADSSRQAQAGAVTGNYFATLGVRLAAGRGFTKEEERPGSGAAVAVLSDAAWRALGGGPGVLGRSIRINARPFTVVGIAPAGFAGTMVGFGPQVWIPIGAEGVIDDEPATAERPPGDRTRRALLLVGRLRDGLALTTADAALTGVAMRLRQDDPAGNARRVLTVSPLARTQEGNDPRDDSGLLAPLGTLAGLALILLVVASLNVANMQLARHAARRKEIAMRLALGAGRARIVQQLLTEGLLLALAGGTAGLVLGAWTLRLVVLSFTPMIDEATSIVLALDRRVILATLGYSVLSAVVFAVGPSLRLPRVSLLADLKNAGREGAASGSGHRLGPRHLLVAGQVALSLALLTAAGLFVRAAFATGRAEPGYRLEGQLIARVDGSGLPGGQGRQSLDALLDRIRSMPGVASASVASLVAFGNESSGRMVQRAGATRERGSSGSGAVLAQDFIVGTAYFRTLGLSLLRGREFTQAEEREPGTSRLAIIDEPLANAIFPGEDPLGRRIEFASSQAGESLEIVGVAPGLRHRLTNHGPVPHVYRPLGAQYLPRLNVHVRQAAGGSIEATGLLRDLRQALRAVDPRLAVLGVSTLEEWRDASPTSWLVRTAGQAFGALGIIALAMAAAGLYGVKAYLVTNRRREIGIRMALGASAESVVSMVLREGAVLVGAGVLIGFVLALGAGRIVSRLLVGVRPLDPLVLVLATSVLTVAVLTASYVPARRATRVDPIVTLREE